MAEFERPSFRSVVLVGLAFFLVIIFIVGIGTYRQEQDEKVFCLNHSGVVRYPICERNVFRFCHGKSNATIFVDCGG